MEEGCRGGYCDLMELQFMADRFDELAALPTIQFLCLRVQAFFYTWCCQNLGLGKEPLRVGVRQV